MQKLKFSFAALIAIIALGTTIATQAFGTRALTACYELVQLQDEDAINFFEPAVSDDCEFVKDEINSLQTFYLAAVPSVTRTGCPITSNVFCCIEFDLVSSPAPSTVPTLTVGGQTGQFEIINVRCKIQ